MESSFSSKCSAPVDGRPHEKWWGRNLYQWKGYWFRDAHLDGVINASSSNLQAQDEDVLLASSIKTGTTWLKAIIPSIINPINGDDPNQDPLLKHHPNHLMPSLELELFKQKHNPDLSAMPSPRLFRTHLPYLLLPESIKSSDCKIVYITRDAKDTFVSMWHFLNSIVPAEERGPWTMDQAFDSFCRGVHVFGPFHDHVLSYWKESLQRPEKILFLRYEDMKEDPKGEVKKLAYFLGRPLATEEEVEQVVSRCSLQRLKNLEINRNGVDPFTGVDYKFYFRNGNVGDHKSEITEDMKEKLDQLTSLKFRNYPGLGYDN